jgi:hypothetical protein
MAIAVTHMRYATIHTSKHHVDKLPKDKGPGTYKFEFSQCKDHIMGEFIKFVRITKTSESLQKAFDEASEELDTRYFYHFRSVERI